MTIWSYFAVCGPVTLIKINVVMNLSKDTLGYFIPKKLDLA